MRHSSTLWWTKAVQNRMIALIMAMVVIVPFIATPAESSLHGAAAMIIEIFGLLLLVALLWRSRFNITGSDVTTFLKTGANTPVLLFLLLVFASVAFSPQKGFSMQEALRIGCGALVYFIVAYQFRRSEHISRLVDILVWIAIGVSLVSFIQYGTTPNEQQSTAGLFGDHQLFGSFLMLLLPIVCVMAITEKAPTKKLIAQIGAVLSVVALLLSHSRSAWIGSAVSLAALGGLAFYIASNRTKFSHRKHETVLPVGLMVIAVGFFLLVSPSASSIVDRAETMTHFKTTNGMKYRERMWRGAMQMVKEHPWTGVGIGMYPYIQQKFTGSGSPLYMLRDTNTHLPKSPSLGEQAHNTYLQTAAELGLPGLALLIAIPLAFLVLGVMRVRKMDEGIRRNVLLGSLGAIVAFAVDAAGSPAWQLGQVSIFFWLILGLGVGSLRPRSKHYVSSAEEIPQQPRRMQRFTRFASVVGAIGGFALLPSINYAVCNTDYSDPVSAKLIPQNGSIPINTSQTYQLLVQFSAKPGVDFDVSDCPSTEFDAPVLTPHASMVGKVYTAGPARTDTGVATIHGSFTQNGITVENSTTLTVTQF